MRSFSLYAAAAFLAFGSAAVHAADSTDLAERGGFLLGNARRCGIPADRVVRAGKTVQALIAASAADAREIGDATARFAEFFIASAYPDKDTSALAPVCKAVASEFDRLEQHRLHAKALVGPSLASQDEPSARTRNNRRVRYRSQ